MNAPVKYPSTPHLPFSPGLQRDDTRIWGLEGFAGREIVVTEKLDGENTTMYSDRIHARSVDSAHHPSRDWVKGFWGSIRHMIPSGWRICGENVYARHSIAYDDLETYFYGFSVWDERNIALSWDDTMDIFCELGIVPVPTLYRGPFGEDVLLDLVRSLDVERQEGLVVRVADEIPYADFGRLVAKWVRPGHVQANKHWAHQKVVPNGLRKEPNDALSHAQSIRCG